MLKKLSKRLLIGSFAYYTTYKFLDHFPASKTKYDLQGLMSSNINFLRTTKFAADCLLDYSINIKIKQPLNQKKEISKFQKRVAKRFSYLCSSNKGIFVKLEHHIGNSEKNNFPKKIKSELKKLEDKGTPVEKIVVEFVLKKEFGEEWVSLIGKIEEDPFEVTSLWQRNKGKDFKGNEISVKIQYPELQMQNYFDIWTLGLFSQVFHKICKSFDLPNYEFEKIFEKFKNSLESDIDFRNEIGGFLESKEFFKDVSFVKVPKIYQKVSSERVVTMEYLEGVSIDKKLKKMNFSLFKISKLIMDLFSNVLFKKEHVYCDSDVGNIYFRQNPKNLFFPQIIILDHKIYKKYSKEFRKNVNELCLSLQNLDNKNLKFYSEKLGIKDYYYFFPIIDLLKKLKNKIKKDDYLKIKQEIFLKIKKFYFIIHEYPISFIWSLKNLLFIYIKDRSLLDKTKKSIFEVKNFIYRKKELLI